MLVFRLSSLGEKHLKIVIIRIAQIFPQKFPQHKKPHRSSDAHTACNKDIFFSSFHIIVIWSSKIQIIFLYP